MLKELDNYDWSEVFGEGGGGNCGKQTDPCPPDSKIDTTPPTREDVSRIIAMVDEENDGPAWLGVFELKDGRFLFAEGSCDYTGWDCQAGNSLEVVKALGDLMQFGLNADQKTRLGL